MINKLLLLLFRTVKRPYRTTQNLELEQTNGIFKILQDILNSVQTRTI